MEVDSQDLKNKLTHDEMHFLTSQGNYVPTCSQYGNDLRLQGYANLALSVVIIFINLIIKFQITGLIRKMKLPSQSEEAVYAMIAITLMQFFNTAVLLLVRLYLETNQESLFSLDVQSITVYWYIKYAPYLVGSMKVMAAWPMIELGMYGAAFKLLRYFDRGFTRDKFKTKLPTIQTYIDLHAGPPFAIHWRYSAVLLQFSVALLFGAGMPVLYIVALSGTVFQLIADRLLVCYFYREPPHYDESMTLVAIKSLRLFAICGCLGTWFILRSEEIFGSTTTNTVGAIDKANYYLSPSHNPLLLLLGICLFYLFLRLFGTRLGINNYLKLSSKSLDQKTEGLVSYWEALKFEKYRSLTIDREVYYREKYPGLVNIPEQSFQKLL